MSAALPVPIECCQSTCTGSTSTGASGGGGVLSGNGHPSLVYPTPPNVDLSYLYTDFNTGIVYPWNPTTHAWIG